MEPVSREAPKKVRRGVSFAAPCIPFIICMCEKLHNRCYLFFSLAPPSPSSCNYEYGKKCQDVFGEEAVDFREDTDYFPEIHRIMIVFVCAVLSACKGRDRCWAVLPPVVSNGMRDSRRCCKQNNHCPYLLLKLLWWLLSPRLKVCSLA